MTISLRSIASSTPQQRNEPVLVIAPLKRDSQNNNLRLGGGGPAGDAGAHLGEGFRRNLTDSGRSPRDDDSLTFHERSRFYSLTLSQPPPMHLMAKGERPEEGAEDE